MFNPGGNAVGATILGSLEGSISVLLTILTGYVVTRMGLMDKKTTKKVSKLCTSLFLPCLLVEQMGPQLTAKNLSKLWIMPVWSVLSTLIAHGIGWVGYKILKLPRWTIIAAGRANSSALPLLLIDALDSTGVLDALKDTAKESPSETLARAKTLILLNAIVQQCFTFAIGPEIIRKPDSEEPDHLAPGEYRRSGHATVQDAEHVGLLVDHDGMDEDEEEAYRSRGGFGGPMKALEDTPDVRWPRRLKFMEKPVKKVLQYYNPPLIGATVALIFGLISPLRHEFFEKDGIFYNSLTGAITNLGGLFVALQMFTVGGELATVQAASPGVKPTVFTLFVRYFVMPVVSVGFVFATAKKGIYDDDPLIWFLMVLLPCGPSAMVLANLAEMVDNDQGPIAGYLTVAYMFSPLISLTATLALIVVDKLQPSPP